METSFPVPLDTTGIRSELQSKAVESTKKYQINIRHNNYQADKSILDHTFVLFTVQLLGETAFLYLLCEHQSSVDHLMPFRMWEYIIKIWREYIKKTGRNFKKLPLVIPLCFYHGKESYNASMDIRDIIQAPRELIDEILFKPFHLIDMHNIEDKTLREQHWAGIMSFVMKHIYARDFLNHLDHLIEMLSKLTVNEGADETYHFLVTVLIYILNTSEVSDLNEFVFRIHEKLPRSVGENFMTAAECLIQQGMQQGMQQGIKQGSQLTLANMLIDQINIKFGHISASYKKKIKNANLEQLSLWTKRIIAAKNLHQIFAEELVN